MNFSRLSSTLLPKLFKPTSSTQLDNPHKKPNKFPNFSLLSNCPRTGKAENFSQEGACAGN
jgi:hypothetical protein